MLKVLYHHFLPLTIYFITLITLMMIGLFTPYSSDIFYLWYFGFYWIFYHVAVYVTSFFIGIITQKRNIYNKPRYLLLISLIFFILNTFALLIPILKNIIESTYRNYDFETLLYFTFISFISTLTFFLGLLLGKKLFCYKS